MSLDTYTNLQTAVLTWLARPGDALISGSVPDWITLFESEANTRLRNHAQETSYSFSTVAGTAAYAVPAGFREPRWLKITSTTPIMELAYQSPGNLDLNWSVITSGLPQEFTIEGSNIRLGPTPDAVYTVALDYYAVIPPLASNSTNWLLTGYPNLYLYGALSEAEPFLGADNTDTRFALWSTLKEKMYQRIEMDDRKFRWGSSPLTMRTDVSNP